MYYCNPMKRLFFIKIHLYLSGLVLFFVAFMSLSGALHMFNVSENEKKITLKILNETEINSKKELEELFKENLLIIDPKYTYDTLKGSETKLMSRPLNRVYYSIKFFPEKKKAIIKRHLPDINKAIMEFHKGHGPKVSRTALGILGLITFGASISGLWLGLSSNSLRKTTLITMISGGLIYFLLFFF